ncbi:unnamed protein product [Caretta caretta]
MEGLGVNLINVYAPTSGPERLHFYQQASAFLGSLDPRECLVLGRDFTTTLEERDSSGTKQCPAATDVFQEIVDPWWMSGVTTTWTTSRRSPSSGWRPINRATPGWTTFTSHAVTFHGPTPPASGRPRSQITT